jgi:hypothetical protein
MAGLYSKHKSFIEWAKAETKKQTQYALGPEDMAAWEGSK